VNDFHSGGGPLEGLPFSPSGNFLGLPPEFSEFESSKVALLPAPYEATVSWMAGTRFGPGAMIAASDYLELYDHELDTEPFKVGIHTLPELMFPLSGPEDALGVLRQAMDQLLDLNKFVIMLGGEHSLSSPPILAHADRMSDRRISVLQLDAHTDLRPEYGDTPFSHACVMHRVMDRVDLVPVGIRSMTVDERALVRDRNIPITFAHELEAEGWIDRILERLNDDVYITFDIDYFDPGIMPSTGTPEPGGGRWHPTIELLTRVFQEKRVVGADIVELSPIPGLVAPDLTAAKLLYKMIGLFALDPDRHGNFGANTAV
jgi:agmatinase